MSDDDRPCHLGFAGLGWIGRQRMSAILASGDAEAIAWFDPDPAAIDAVVALAPEAEAVTSYEAMLELPLDGIVVATPSALHAEQSRAALDRGMAVFCQKPLGRAAEETRAVVEAARAADRLLQVDLSYRRVRGVERMIEIVRAGGIGRVLAIDLVFHNAYGPDKPWFRDLRLSGGGCVVDLGSHLVDLAHLFTNGARVVDVGSHLFADGRLLDGAPDRVEDLALADLVFENGVVARLACSWNLHAGRDAVIACDVFGSAGAVTLRNVDGSFHDFVCERCTGTSRETLAGPPDAWGGRAAVAFARRLRRDPSFDEAAMDLVELAEILDRIYGRTACAF